MTREELVEVMARAILQDHEDGANMDTHAVPERAASRHAIAALSALEAAGVRLVPVEVTENMHDAFFYTRDHAWPKHRDERKAEGRGWRTLPYAIWDAMLAASPYALKEPGQ